MQHEAQNLANAFARSSKRRERFTFTSGTSEGIVIVIAKVAKGKSQTLTETFDRVAKRIDSQEVSFQPSGGCPCCGR